MDSLVQAIENHEYNKVKYILTNDTTIDVNQRIDKTTMYPIELASMQGDIEMVKLLMKHGAFCQNALAKAVIAGNVELVHYLLYKYTCIGKQEKVAKVKDEIVDIVEMIIESKDT